MKVAKEQDELAAEEIYPSVVEWISKTRKRNLDKVDDHGDQSQKVSSNNKKRPCGGDTIAIWEK